MLKRQRLTPNEASVAVSSFSSIAFKEMENNLECVLVLCAQYNIYAYDAYYLDVAQRYSRPFITLDAKMREVAIAEKIKAKEI